MLGDSVRRRLPASRPWRRLGRERPAGEGGARWRFWIPALVAALAAPFAIGYAVAVLVLFPPREVRGQGIEVPRLIGLELGRAREDARAAGLGDLEVSRLPHPTRASGVVTAQSPLEGQELRAGATVRVAVSDGRPTATIPDVVSFSAERAEGLLARLGFGVVRIDEESTVEQGRVTRVDPVPGTMRELPSTVTVMVSTGPPLDTLFDIDSLMQGFPSDTLRPRTRIDTIGSRDTTRQTRGTATPPPGGGRLAEGRLSHASAEPAHGRGEYGRSDSLRSSRESCVGAGCGTHDSMTRNSKTRTK